MTERPIENQKPRTAVIDMDLNRHRNASPRHTDPFQDQPLGIDAPSASERVPSCPAVWVEIEFSRSGPQMCPGFVEQADGEVVHVQFLYMGFVHRAWVPAGRITRRSPRTLQFFQPQERG